MTVSRTSTKYCLKDTEGSERGVIGRSGFESDVWAGSFGNGGGGIPPSENRTVLAILFVLTSAMADRELLGRSTFSRMTSSVAATCVICGETEEPFSGAIGVT